MRVTYLFTACSCAILLSTLPLNVSGETTYVVAFLGLTHKGRSAEASISYKTALTNTENKEITVNVRGRAGLINSLTIAAQEHKTIIFNNSHALHGSQLRNKSLVFSSKDHFILQVYVTNHYTGHVEGFLGIPLNELLGPYVIQGYYEYIVATYCVFSGYCQFAVAARENRTHVSITLPPSVEDIIVCVHGSYFHTKQHRLIILDQYSALQIETTMDLSGTRIYSQKPIVVFVGSRNLTRDNVTGHVIEQLHTASKWGTNYIIRSLGSLKSDLDIIKIAANWANTTVQVPGCRTFKIANYSHVITRLIKYNKTYVITASKQIQIVQISGAKRLSSNGKFSSGMVVVSPWQLRAAQMKGYCDVQMSFQLFMTNLTKLAEPTTYVEIIHNFRPAVLKVVSMNLNSTGMYSVRSTNNHTIGGVMKCGESAIMAINIQYSELRNVTSKRPNDEAIICADGYEAQTEPGSKAHNVDIGAYRKIRVRVRSCGKVLFQFHNFSKNLTTSSFMPDQQIVFVATMSSLRVMYFSNSEMLSQNYSRYSYNSRGNCSTDITSYWFTITGNNTRICGGPGPFYGKHETCVNMTSSLSPNRLTMMGLDFPAYFHYDLENDKCNCRLSTWRCEDRISNCTKYEAHYCANKNYPDFKTLCPRFCGQCKQDRYGREFRLVFPGFSNWNRLTQCKVYILSTVPNPNVFVGGPKQLSTIKQLSDNYFTTNCLPKFSKPQAVKTNVKVIMSNVDISVHVIISTRNEKMLTYAVYPVDTFSTEFIPITHHKTDCRCNLVSLERTSVAIGYANSNQTNTFSIQVEPSISVVINALSGNAGHQIISNAPISVFCCSEITNSSQSFYQLQPSFSLGTSYVTPRVSSRNLTKSVNTTLFVHAVNEKTTCQIVDMSNTAKMLTNKFNDTLVYEINPETSYKITADGQIAVGILYRDAVGYSQFIQVPSLKGFVRHTKIAFPLYLFSRLFTSFTITVYFISQTGAINIVAPLNNISEKVSYLTYDSSPHFSVTVLTGNNSWLLIAEPGQFLKDTYQTPICITSFPEVGDNLDNDCDGLTDEDTCAARYGVPGIDNDADGAYNEDCGNSSSQRPTILPPKTPMCFKIRNSHLSPCWKPCKCPCHWKSNLENFNRLTVEERTQFIEGSNEKFRQLLQIKKELLSKTKSTKISLPDGRVSAKGIGIGGVGLVVCFLATIVILDMKSLTNAFYTFYYNIRSLYGGPQQIDVQ